MDLSTFKTGELTARANDLGQDLENDIMNQPRIIAYGLILEELKKRGVIIKPVIDITITE